MISDFKTSGYFKSFHIMFAIALLPIASVVAMNSVLGAAVMVLASLVILTTHYRFRLDTTARTYFDYVWILGMKYGERGSYREANYLFLKASNVKQTMNSRGSSSTISKQVIDAYLKLDGETRIHLFSKDSRHDVIVRLKEISRMIGVPVVDYTSGEPQPVQL